MKHDHVVMEVRSNQFLCLHCGAAYAPAMPAPVDLFVAMTKEFLKAHKDCKPSRKEGGDDQRIPAAH